MFFHSELFVFPLPGSHQTYGGQITIGLLVFLLLICNHSLYVKEMNPLCQVAYVFPQLVHFL